MKKIIRTTLAGLYILLALIAITLLLLTLPPGEHILRGVAESQLSDNLGLEASIESLETNLFSRVELRNVVLRNVPTPDTCEALLKAGTLELRYGFWGLLRGRLVLQELNVDSMQLCLHRDSAGLFGIPAVDFLLVPSAATVPSASGTEEPPVDYSEATVVLRSLSVQYSDDSLTFDAILKNLSARAEPLARGGHRFNVAYDSLALAYDSMAVTSADLLAFGTAAGDSLKIDSLSVTVEEVRLSASVAVLFDDSSTVSGEIAVTGNAGRIADIIAKRYDLAQVAFQGDLNLAGTVEGILARPSVRASLHFPPLVYDDLSAGPGTLNLAWLDNTLSFDSLAVSAFGGEFFARGEVRLDSIVAAQMEATLRNLEIGALWSFAYRQPSLYEGRLNGSLSVSGQSRDTESWRLNSNVSITNAKYDRQAIPDFRASVGLDDGIANLTVEHESLHISAEGKIDQQSINGRFSAVINDLVPTATFFNIPELKGSVDVSGSIAGVLKSPSVKATVSAGNISYQNFPVDSLQARIEFADSVLEILAMDFNGHLERIDAAAPPFHIDSFSGGFAYTGKANGSLGDLQAHVAINAFEPGYNDITVDSLTIKAKLDSPRRADVELSAYKDSLTAEAQLEFSLIDSTGVLRAKIARLHGLGSLTADFDISDTSHILIKANATNLDMAAIAQLVADTIDASGRANVKLNFEGTYLNPQARLIFEATNPRYENLSLDSLHADVELAEDRLTATAIRSYVDNHVASASGAVQLSRDSAGIPTVSGASYTEGTITLDSFDLSLTQPFLTEGGTVAGLGMAELSWAGPFEWPHPHGRIGLSGGVFVLEPGGQPIENVWLSATVRDSVLTIDSLSGTAMNKPFVLGGSLAVSRRPDIYADLELTLVGIGAARGRGRASKDSVDFEANVSSFDLSLLEPFLPRGDTVEGRLESRLRIKGAVENPEVYGNLDISVPRYRSHLLAVPVTNGVVRARFDRRRIELDSLTALVGGGRLHSTGSITLHEMNPVAVDISTSVDSVKIVQPDQFTVDLQSARLKYSGEGDAFLLDGDVIFGESKLTANFKPQAILPWAQSVERPRVELPEFVQKTRMNIRIRESDRLWVDNNLARMRLHTELGIIGYPHLPNMTGRMSVEEGYLLYLDRKFKVTKGEIYYLEPDRFNPDINLTAQTVVTAYEGTTATSYTVTFSALGQLDNVMVSLTSEPALDKPDIVTLLTLGATRTQLAGKDAGGESGARSALIERATSLSSDKISGYVSRKAGTFLGLDEVSVKGNLFRFDRSWGPQLLASKKFSERIEMTYTTTVGHLNDQSIRLDYYLSRRFALQGQTDRQGRANINLKLGMRFK